MRRRPGPSVAPGDHRGRYRLHVRHRGGALARCQGTDLTAYRGRFAPSPTGPLHLGLARTALVAWLRARSQGGAFLLRSEDIDGPRVVSSSLAQIMASMRFLGLDWDEGPDVGGPHAPYEQSLRYDRYRAALDTLQRAGRIYGCKCTRKELAIASAPHGEFGPVYPGTCRQNGLADDLARRFVVEDELPGFVDGLLGEVPASAQGDFIVQRADGTVSYQLAVVVDDIAMGITEVVRGADLAGCTGWQLSLYRALGAEPPAFVHAPLLLGEDGKRLAKRDRAIAVDELRERGVSAERIIGAIAASLGLGDGRELEARALIPSFELARIDERPFDFASIDA
ncbi:MAG TPA: tRNA glutamyl-Q(34) synthetase GluQRS [Polyangiales bacterium]|nr:tRNA glutamyl-Q(34) synthetase GluQRS [Polyangiales bacterium]